jgi:opacity protein-like surface antigen
VLVGVEDFGDSGVSLRGDLELPQKAISPQVGFAVVPSIGYSRFSNDYTDPWAGVEVDEALNLIRGMAAARFTFGNHPTFRPYADAGLGLYLANYSFDYRDSFSGISSSDSQSEFGMVLRFAGGVQFQLSPTFALGAEIGFQPYVGDGPDDTSTNLLFSASFRM